MNPFKVTKRGEHYKVEEHDEYLYKVLFDDERHLDMFNEIFQTDINDTLGIRLRPLFSNRSRSISDLILEVDTQVTEMRMNPENELNLESWFIALGCREMSNYGMKIVEGEISHTEHRIVCDKTEEERTALIVYARNSVTNKAFWISESFQGNQEDFSAFEKKMQWIKSTMSVSLMRLHSEMYSMRDYRRKCFDSKNSPFPIEIFFNDKEVDDFCTLFNADSLFSTGTGPVIKGEFYDLDDQSEDTIVFGYNVWTREMIYHSEPKRTFSETEMGIKLGISKRVGKFEDSDNWGDYASDDNQDSDPSSENFNL